MWSIGIKSGIITMLGLLVYGLLAPALGISYPLRGALEYLVLALGIYSAHFYYKAAHEGRMSYAQGLQLGLLTTACTGFLNGLLLCWCVQHSSVVFTQQLTRQVKVALQQMGLDATSTDALLKLIQPYLKPQFFFWSTLGSTLLLGLVFTLVISAFSRYPRSQQPQA